MEILKHYKIYDVSNWDTSSESEMGQSNLKQLINIKQIWYKCV